jgi:hypothetical protein
MALVSELYFFGIRWYIWVHKALYEQGKNYSIVLYSILGTAHTLFLILFLRGHATHYIDKKIRRSEQSP